MSEIPEIESKVVKFPDFDLDGAFRIKRNKDLSVSSQRVVDRTHKIIVVAVQPVVVSNTARIGAEFLVAPTRNPHAAFQAGLCLGGQCSIQLHNKVQNSRRTNSMVLLVWKTVQRIDRKT
jgi:hypothetical protein